MHQNYITGQTEFVLNYDFDFPQDHVIRLIDVFVDQIPQEILFEENVSTTGRLILSDNYLKILLFAYSRQTYSGRKFEMMLEESLPMRWLARDHTYSYHTINNFCSSQHASKLIKRAFIYFSMTLTDHESIKSDVAFINGRKQKLMLINALLLGGKQLKSTTQSYEKRQLCYMKNQWLSRSLKK